MPPMSPKIAKLRFLSLLLLPLIFLICLSAKVSYSQGGAAAFGASPPCERADLSPRPGWTISGVWRGKELLVVDNLNASILRYSDRGRPLGSLPKGLSRGIEDQFPTVIRPRGTGFTVSASGGTLLSLDQNYYVTQKVDTYNPDFKRRVRGKDNLAVRSLYDWAVAGSDIVSFSDLNYSGEAPGRESREFKTGFLRFPLSDPGSVTILKEVPTFLRETVFYRTGLPYITAIDSTAYILDFSQKSIKILKNEKGKGIVELPDVLGRKKVPDLPEFNTAQDFVTLMKAIEYQDMPVGLYAWGGDLYVLARAKGERTGTTWLLTRIDPNDGQVTGIGTLPLRAAHVFAVPGPEKWAFIEKGPVKAYGYQDISTVFFVPSELIFSMPTNHGKICR